MRASERVAEPVAFSPCDEVVGHYRLRFTVAAGGMATVYVATHSNGRDGEERVCALKRVRPHLAQQTEFVEMFLDEARIASLVSHPNVCRVRDFGGGDGTWWLAMDLLLGQPVGKVINACARARAHPPAIPGDRPDVALAEGWPAVAARLVAEACEGLHAAHELRDGEGRPLGVVHRDVSPQNLFVGFDGHVRVLDFGIATARQRLHQTETGIVKGKFAYMAPEQMRGDPLDRRADVWSLGVVLWEALALKALFRAKNDGETIQRVLTASVPPLGEVAPQVPPELAAITARALHPDPAERWPTARALGDALTRFALASEQAPTDADDVSRAMQILFPAELHHRRALVREALSSPGSSISVHAVTPRDSWEPPRPPSDQAVTRRVPAPGRRPLVLGGALVALVTCAVAASILTGARWRKHARAEELGPAAAGTVVASRVHERAWSTGPLACLDEPVGFSSSALSSSPPVAGRRRNGAQSASVGLAARQARVAKSTRAQPRTARERRGNGEVHIVAIGGWADVYHGVRRLGPTPGRFTLPAGYRTLTLWPGGGGSPVHRTVLVQATGVTRVRADLRVGRSIAICAEGGAPELASSQAMAPRR